jgi:hypothetical protein
MQWVIDGQRITGSQARVLVSLMIAVQWRDDKGAKWSGHGTAYLGIFVCGWQSDFKL